MSIMDDYLVDHVNAPLIHTENHNENYQKVQNMQNEALNLPL